MAGADVSAGLLDVSGEDRVSPRVSFAVLADLRQAEELLSATLSKHLAEPLGTVLDQFTGLLLDDQDGIPSGTPVFVRRTDSLTEQYAFTRVSVSISDGSVSMPGLAGPRPGRRSPNQIHAVPFVSLLLSVSPFLPPPWGAGVTFGLSLLNMLSDTASGSDPLTSEFNKLNTQIQQLLSANSQDPLDTVSRNVTKLGNLLPTNVKLQDIRTLDSNVENLREYIDGLHVDGAVAPGRNDSPTFFQGKAFDLLDEAQSTIWGRLQTCDDTNFDATLGLMIRSLVLRISVQKQSIQLRAMSAKVYQDAKLMESFNTEVSTWLDQIDSVVKDYWDPAVTPVVHPGDALPALSLLTSDQTKAILGDGQTEAGTKAWVPLLVAWLARTRADRLALIDDSLTRMDYVSDPYVQQGKSYPVYAVQWKDEQGTEVPGWIWRDQRVGKTYDENGKNWWPDYYARPCFKDLTQQIDAAQADRTTYFTQTSNGLDTRMKEALDNLAALGTLIKNLRDLLPPSAPTQIPAITPLKGGEPSGSDPVWNIGNVIRYRVMLQNAKGPGPAGDWSADYVVGGVKGCTVTGLRLESPAESIQLQRQVRTATQGWDQAQQPSPVASLTPDPATKVMPGAYDDTSGPT